MKIYHVEFFNRKYQGETNRTVSVSARNMKEAEQKGIKALRRLLKEDYATDKGYTNWEAERIEFTDEV